MRDGSSFSSDGGSVTDRCAVVIRTARSAAAAFDTAIRTDRTSSTRRLRSRSPGTTRSVSRPVVRTAGWLPNAGSSSASAKVTERCAAPVTVTVTRSAVFFPGGRTGVAAATTLVRSTPVTRGYVVSPRVFSCEAV